MGWLVGTGCVTIPYAQVESGVDKCNEMLGRAASLLPTSSSPSVSVSYLMLDDDRVDVDGHAENTSRSVHDGDDDEEEGVDDEEASSSVSMSIPFTNLREGEEEGGRSGHTPSTTTYNGSGEATGHSSRVFPGVGRSLIDSQIAVPMEEE